MLKLLIFCLLLVVCWPAAVALLILYPVVWLVLLPFRVAGLAVCSVCALLGALVCLPGRVLRAV